jgi:Caspase domain
MPKEPQAAFTAILDKFKVKQYKAFQSLQPKLILIIMANTLDKELAAGCEQDVKRIRKMFKKICAHSQYTYLEIVITGDFYHTANLSAAIRKLEPMLIDVTVFYFSGHGFCYAHDRSRKFPQLDMRHPVDTEEFNHISNIRKYSKNLHEVLQKIRLRGGRVNIVIGDCCSTLIKNKRTSSSTLDLQVVEDVMAPVDKSVSKKEFYNEESMIDIIVSAAQIGQTAVADDKAGSIFTKNFTKALQKVFADIPKGEKYFPWHKLLKKSAEMANKEAQQYDVGNNTPGQQMATFEIYRENINFDDLELKS